MTQLSPVSEIKRIMESLESINDELKAAAPSSSDNTADPLVDEVPLELEERRNAIAEIIDPVAWDSHPYNMRDQDQLLSLDKADRILDYLHLSDTKKVYEDASGGATGAGSIASVASPFSKQVISRTPSLFGYIERAEKKITKKRKK